jgi:hypothetical protein
MQYAVLLIEGSQARLVCPYNSDFLSEMKERTTYYARRYEAESRSWIFDLDQVDDVEDVASSYFTVRRVVSDQEAGRRVADAVRRAREVWARETRPSGSHDSQECLRKVRGIWREEAELYLLPGAPFDVVRAAYRAVSKLFHPDMVGSDGHARMVAINNAYSALEKRSKGVSA